MGYLCRYHLCQGLEANELRCAHVVLMEIIEYGTSCEMRSGVGALCNVLDLFLKLFVWLGVT